MDPKEIFDLIIKADEKLKYASEANATLRQVRRGRSWSRRATPPARSATRRWSNRLRRAWPT